MRYVFASVVLLATLVSVQSGEYCDDFEGGELGPFWGTSDLDSRGGWKVASYQDLKRSVPDFPEPANGDNIAYLTGSSEYEVYTYGRLQMTEEYVFPAGSTLSFRYWFRTDYSAGTLEVRRQEGEVEEKEPFLSLTASSGQNNTDWIEVSVPIPESSHKQKIIIFGACKPHPENNIAVDDVKICGPSGLNQQCYAMTTTYLPSPTTESPTTAAPTTESPTTAAPTTEATTTTESSPTTTETSPTTTPSSGEYCDDFESDDFGVFWRQGSTDNGGRWQSSSYAALKSSVPDFPAPTSGDTVLYLTPIPFSGYISARLEMTESFVFPEGSSVSFRYWLRSQYTASATLLVELEMGQQGVALLDLSVEAGPQNDQWRQASVQIPAVEQPAKITIFGACGVQPLDNIAIDDIRVCGPQGLDHKCVPMAVSWY